MPVVHKKARCGLGLQAVQLGSEARCGQGLSAAQPVQWMARCGLGLAVARHMYGVSANASETRPAAVLMAGTDATSTREECSLHPPRGPLEPCLLLIRAVHQCVHVGRILDAQTPLVLSQRHDTMGNIKLEAYILNPPNQSPASGDTTSSAGYSTLNPKP